MKRRFLALVFSLILLCTSLPIGALAQDNVSAQSDLIHKACEVFPEYASKIMTQTISNPPQGRSSQARELIASVERAVSDNEYIIYSEYSDGIILLTDYEFKKTVTTNSLSTSAYAYNYDVTIRATCSSVSGYFELRNVKYNLIRDAYDTISDTGTEVLSDNWHIMPDYPAYKLAEDSSGNAYIAYRLIFQFGATGYYSFNSMLTLSVGADRATVTHVNDT